MIQFMAHLDPNKQALTVTGEGVATLKLTTSADQLASVIMALATMSGQLMQVTLTEEDKPYERPSDTRKEVDTEESTGTPGFDGAVETGNVPVDCGLPN